MTNPVDKVISDMLVVNFQSDAPDSMVPPEDSREAQIGRSIVQLAQELIDLHTIQQNGDFEDPNACQ